MRPAGEALTAPGGLAERLAGLRSAAGLKAIELAEATGWARSKISKIENGNQIPTADDIRAWAEATNHPEVTDELIAMLRQVQEAHTRWRRRLRATARHKPAPSGRSQSRHPGPPAPLRREDRDQRVHVVLGVHGRTARQPGNVGRRTARGRTWALLLLGLRELNLREVAFAQKL